MCHCLAKAMNSVAESNGAIRILTGHSKIAISTHALIHSKNMAKIGQNII